MTTAAPIMIRNTLPGPTVFTSKMLGQHVEWAGNGDPNGGDVQPCPPEFLNDVQFRSSVVRGIFEVEEAGDGVEEILAKHRNEWDSRQTRQREMSEASIDQVADNDVLMLDCIGPNGHSGSLCGEPVPVKSTQVSEKPPLCGKHKSLVKQFISEETGEVKNGKPVIRWMRTTMGQRATQQD